MKNFKGLTVTCLIAVFYTFGFYACNEEGQQKQETVSETSGPASNCIKLFSDTSIAPRFTKRNPWEPPYDVSGPGSDLESIQHDFDVYSWETFIALNWPALNNGAPDSTTCIGSNRDNNTVWETWLESNQIFRSGGQQPVPWGSPKTIPNECNNLSSRPSKMLTQIAKVPDDLLQEFSQPFNTGPIIDQDSNYARFEILVNHNMFDYILNNKLYSKTGQQDFFKKQDAVVDFHSGSVDSQKVGAIMVKAAWKIMNPEDDTSRYHTTTAIIDNDSDCSEELVGLVGFHIGHKTVSAPQWIWSTFEQVDNVPEYDEKLKGPKVDKSRYNFFKPNCKNCLPMNQTPPRPWNPAEKNTPSQIVRLTPVDPATRQLNEQYHNLLTSINANTVWQYYELISTQWPTDPGDPDVNPDGTPAPQFLANTTLETYIQGIIKDGKVVMVPNSSSSCIRCHGNATTTNGKFSDFTYLLERAQ